MQPSTLHSQLESWAHSNNDLFARHGLTESKISVSKGPALWKSSGINYPSNFDHPGITFFEAPSVVVNRNYSYPNPSNLSDCSPQYNLFTYDSSKLPEDAPEDLDEIVKRSPPLVSVFTKNQFPPPLQDQRTDVGILKPGQILYYTLTFDTLSSTSPIIEPIVINVFLWDLDKHKKLSAIWRFLPSADNCEKSLMELIQPTIINGPTSMSIPHTQSHKRIAIIVSLDRLLLKSAGSSLTKYYEKSGSSARNAALNDLHQCNQKWTLITFAWAWRPYTVLPTCDSTPFKFTNFFSTQTVSDFFLTTALSNSVHSKDKPIPFEVQFKISKENPQIPKLQHRFSFPVSPLLTFVNELVIQPIQARFKFPRHIHGRNIVAEIQIVSDGKPIKCFEGSDIFITHCQYHEETPYFSEDIIAQLPLTLTTNTKLFIKFYHASVKPKAKTNKISCGTSIYNLFKEDGSFINNGIHNSGISYLNDNEIVTALENNFFSFNIILNSNIYSSDLQITNIFKNKLTQLKPTEYNLLIPHLYSVLDKMITNINNNDNNGFNGLIQILSVFQRDRNHQESQYLIFYLKFCALRHEEEKTFHQRFIPMWKNYLKNNEFSQKRPDFINCWFLLELITKSILISKESVDSKTLLSISSQLSSYLPLFRDSRQTIGTTLNKYLFYFYKDLFDVLDHELICKMIQNHLANLNLKNNSNLFDRECFRDIFQTFISPKIFLYLIAPINYIKNSSLFINIFLPHIESAMNIYEHTNELFRNIFNLLLQFNYNEHVIIAPLLIPLLELIGKNEIIFRKCPSKSYLIYIFVVAHYIFYYSKSKLKKKKLIKSALILLKYSTKLTQKELKEIQLTTNKMSSTENITKAMLNNLNGDQTFVLHAEHQTRTRRFASLKMANRNNLFSTNNLIEENKTDYIKIFDSLSFIIQALILKLSNVSLNSKTFNKILIVFSDINIPPLLIKQFQKTLVNFAENLTQIVFNDENSNLKHIINKLIKFSSKSNFEVINKFSQIEKVKFGTNNRINSLISRSLYKINSITKNILNNSKTSIYHKLIKKLYKIENQLNVLNKETNFDIYSNLLYEKAELLKDSPDARLEILLELTKYQIENQYYHEAIIAQITSIALICEYLTKLKRIPDFFNMKNPAKKFCIINSSISSEICPKEIVNDIPKLKGFCTSKYFNEYGIIYLFNEAINNCKSSNLFELSSMIQNILNIIVKKRHLWLLLKDNYVNGSLSYQIISDLNVSNDRNFGNYYRIQFFDGIKRKNFIYREINLMNLWEISKKIKNSFMEYFENEKDVIVLNDGEELDLNKTEKDKFYVHIKSIQQYFTSKDIKKRMTVFDQNNNISMFYFDVPFSKGSQNSIESFYMKRTIFISPHPMPYIIKRVEIPEENIVKEMFTPIEYWTQNIKKQVDSIEEDIIRNDPIGLQPKLQGSLVVQVNEGPKKIAEVFLSEGEDNKEKQKLRKVFRKFLETNAKAVKLHAQFVATHPVYAVLQEEVESGLNTLTSTLQPYLNE